MVYQSAAALADCLTDEEKAQKRLYPNLKRIRQISAEVAAAVCIDAVKEGLARNQEIETVVQDRQKLIQYVMERMWTPESDGYGAEQSISKI
jgi:malate dehydrogenase (oxaloacetate-decarboxylating)(NADP+)